ncbi:hypothetical protein AURDEDRAFT_115756 [Auricularia subglabra TFB-10046 SS5]|uniref:protein kinase C n=1 Tax=Auricularia subglabra (strain TFB-10046 / SS5) TaxID=717982 RepID=J0WWU6_AURST|nr:hypothetical protein AURDEDRAFT_115756 [Auricularia subglabra TFB-10046 SS5]
MASELDAKIQDVYRRIQTEQKVLDGIRSLRQVATNPDVLRKTDLQIREAQQSLSYFQDTLRELQARKRNTAQTSPPTRTSSAPPGAQPHAGALNQRQWTNDRDRALPPPPASQDYDPADSASQDPSRSQPAHYNDGAPRSKQYSNLDLIKADTPHTTAKISRMLHQLEFKLQVEMKYKEGIDKMVKLYQAEGDKRSRIDAESKRVESDKKIQLLQTALKRYKNLHILDDAEEDEEMPGESAERKDNLRKPISGKLQVTVKAARDLDHAPLLKRSAKAANDTSVHIKVEGTFKAKTHPSRTDRWNEGFEIAIDKANEVEIAIIDKQVGEQPTPIGLLWLRISDLVEALRRQKIEQEAGAGGWVTAAGAMGAAPPYNGGGGGSAFPVQGGQQPFGADPNASYALAPQFGPGPANAAGQAEGIDAWFAVEPAGAVALHLNFVKENVRKRPVDAGLGRQGAVRKKKEEIHEMNGHKFVQRQFYQLMLCAFCNEFLLNAAGYQCEDCRYTCHKKCYEKVVTKCISKSNADFPSDEEKINHRIPHRFETITNMGANWCCHCGYMLPLGRRNAKKCSECDITCHATCAHLVPDFCGMSMQQANALLAQIKDIKDMKTRQKSPTSSMRPPGMSPIMQHQLPAQHPQDMGQTLDGAMGDMRIGPDPFAATTRSPGPPVQTQQQQQQQMPYPYTASPKTSAAPRYGDVQQPPARPSFEQPPSDPYGQYQQQQPSQQQGPPPGYQYPQQASPPRQTQPPAVAPPQQQVQPAPTKKPPFPTQPQGQVAVRKRKVGLDDFNFLAVLGKGNFGKVMLAEEKTTSRLWAIKVLKKEFIIDNDEVESTRSEKRVFLAAARERHPFLLDLHSCFQTETRVYFVMEYVSGGDLMLHIQRKQFSLRQAKFYASEVLLALEYFHQNGIIYRDLKLDNILLTLDGHVKVADYGLCKEEMWWGQTTSTFCGTPEFMAPEILLEQRYGLAVDWWAFGVLMYEMLLGQSPFRGDDEDEIFDAILEDEPLYPITMPRDAVSILQKLLTRDPTRRLGSSKSDAEEIKRHPFFKDVSFDDIIHKRIPPPYFPTITSASDTSNFDQEFTREQPTLTPVHGQLSARDQAEFEGFSWVATWADAQ